MWRFDWAGRQVRFDDLTLAQIEHVEALTGASYFEVVPWRSARHARVLLETVCPDLDLADVPLSAFTLAHDDLPEMFEDGIPTKGGRPTDSWVLIGWRNGFTPHQIRNEFTLRDLQLIIHGAS